MRGARRIARAAHRAARVLHYARCTTIDAWWMPSQRLPGRCPRCCCTSTSTAACAWRRCSSCCARAAWRRRPPTWPALARWFDARAHAGSLTEYLRGFALTVAAMASPSALERVAFEAAEDARDDGCVTGRIPHRAAAVRGPWRGGRGGGRSHAGRADAQRPALGLDRLRDAPAARKRKPNARRAWRCATRAAAWSASTSPAPRPATRRATMPVRWPCAAMPACR